MDLISKGVNKSFFNRGFNYIVAKLSIPLYKFAEFMQGKFFYSFWEALWRASMIGMTSSGKGGFDKNGERYIINLLGDYMEYKDIPTPIIFDIGANTGQYALELLKIPYVKNSNIFCFEPIPNNFEILKKKLSLPSIQLFNLALTQENKDIDIFYSDKRNIDTAASLYQERYSLTPEIKESNKNNLKKVTVESKSIDRFCKEKGIKEILFLKVDTEGSELSVLKSANDMIQSKSIRFIQFEFGSASICSRTFFIDFFILLSKEYRVYKVLTNGLIEIKNYHSDEEKFMMQTIFCISRHI